MPDSRRRRGPLQRAATSGALGAAIAIQAVLTSPWRFVRWLTDWLRWWVASRRRRLLAVSALAIMVAAAVLTRPVRHELSVLQAKADRVETAEVLYIPPPTALKLMALGHESFMADMLFLKAKVYFMTHLFSDRIFAWLDTYVSTILALDPDNMRVYEWAAQSVKYGQFITNESLELSNRYSQLGIERFPDNWRFYFDIGFNYLIEWKAETPEEREEARGRALPWFSIAAALPGSEIDPNFVAELYLRENDVEMALFHAYLRYWEASPREQEALRARITRYESEAVAQQLQDVEAAWRAAYSYVPFGLYEQLGPPRDIDLPRDWASAANLAR